MRSWARGSGSINKTTSSPCTRALSAPGLEHIPGKEGSEARVKRVLPTLLLAGILLLSGCSAMLNRPYVVVSSHPEHPGTGEDPSTISVSTYSELVSAVLYFVSQTAQEGHVQLTDYAGDVEADLNAACLEVAKDDPLGAYAVDFIKNDYTRVLTTYEANLYITYRRTPEQVRSLVNVTGASAIRQVLGEALSEFRTEVALRIGYFAEDEAYIRTLVRQAYYDTPAAALGMPDVSVSLYPDQGSQRIVELQLTYADTPEVLQEKGRALLTAAEQSASVIQAQSHGPEELLDALLLQVPDWVRYAPFGPGTAWDALVGEGGDDEGVALALQLLCDLLEMDGSVVEGTLDGAPHFWNQLTDSSGEPRYVDLSRGGTPQLLSGEALAELGYAWGENSPVPAAAAPSVEENGPDVKKSS